MSKKLTGRALARFEARRDIWQEALEGVRWGDFGLAPPAAEIRLTLAGGEHRLELGGREGASVHARFDGTDELMLLPASLLDLALAR